MINLFKTKQVRDEINQHPEKTQEIINASEYCICITNAEGIFEFVNDHYCRTYEYDRSELIGQHFSMVVPSEEQETLTDLHDKFIQDQREISRIWRVQSKTGKILHINVDARFTNKINQTPHKITFVQVKS